MAGNAAPNALRDSSIGSVADKPTLKKSALPPDKRQRETAQYIADMILELRNMAKSAQLYQVMVPLEYAYYEAFSVANKVAVPPEEAERIRVLSKTVAEMDVVPDDY